MRLNQNEQMQFSGRLLGRNLMRAIAFITLLSMGLSACEVKDFQQQRNSPSGDGGNGNGYEGVHDITSKILALDQNNLGSQFTCQDRSGDRAVQLNRLDVESTQRRARFYQKSADGSYDLQGESVLNWGGWAMQPGKLVWRNAVSAIPYLNLTIFGTEPNEGELFIDAALDYILSAGAQKTSIAKGEFFCKPTGDSAGDEVRSYQLDGQPVVRFRGYDAMYILQNLNAHPTSFKTWRSSSAPYDLGIVVAKNVACTTHTFAWGYSPEGVGESANCMLGFSIEGVPFELLDANGNITAVGAKMAEAVSVGGNMTAPETSNASSFNLDPLTKVQLPGKLYQLGFRLSPGVQPESNLIRLPGLDANSRIFHWDGYDARTQWGAMWGNRTKSFITAETTTTADSNGDYHQLAGTTAGMMSCMRSTATPDDNSSQHEINDAKFECQLTLTNEGRLLATPKLALPN